MNFQNRIDFLQRLSSLKYAPDPRTAYQQSIGDQISTDPILSVSKALIIQHRGFLHAAAKIASLHMRSLQYGEVFGMLLTGQSGAGKTKLIKWYRDSHPSWTDAGIDIKPVVLVTTPSKPLVSDLAKQLLIKLGDPLSSAGNKTEKTERILKLLKTCRVEILVFDELQHFLEHGWAAMLEVTNWLKNLIDDAGIPIILVGLPRSESIIQKNEQLARRFCRRHYLSPFTPTSPDSWTEFRGVLKTLHGRCPVEAIEFHRADIAKRFYFASAGLIDYVIRAVNMAVEISSGRRVPIDLDVLGEAFKEAVWAQAPASLNPFVCEPTQLRRLTRQGEPFELWDTTAAMEEAA